MRFYCLFLLHALLFRGARGYDQGGVKPFFHREGERKVKFGENYRGSSRYQYAVGLRDFDTAEETLHANGKRAVGMSSKRSPLRMKVTNILEETI